MSIVVSGLGPHQASWEGLPNCLQAIAAQDVTGQVEVVLVQSRELGWQLSDNLRDYVPHVHVVLSNSRDPWARKTEGARTATAPIIAFLDADCVPESRWLRSVQEIFRFFPEVAVVRGPLGKDGMDWKKLLPERRAAGPVSSTAENNVAFRRDAYLDYPFPEGMGSEAVALQSAALRRAHYVLWAEPAMQAIRMDLRRKPPANWRVRYSTAASR